MATLIPSLGSCVSRMTSGERRLAERLEAKLDDDYLLWYDVPMGPRMFDEMVENVIRGVDRKQIPGGQYQAVMIDEGHDFAPEWLKLDTQMVDPTTTLFFGWNSGGKSALVRFLPLLSESLKVAGPPIWLSGEVGRRATWPELVCKSTERANLKFSLEWMPSDALSASWEIGGDMEGRWQETKSLVLSDHGIQSTYSQPESEGDHWAGLSPSPEPEPNLDASLKKLLQGGGNRFLVEPSKEVSLRERLRGGPDLSVETLESHFIDENAMAALRNGNLEDFIKARAESMERWDAAQWEAEQQASTLL